MSEDQINTFEGEISMPNNHMPLSIISLIVGIGGGPIGIILGILAIYTSNKVKKYFMANNVIDAQKAANSAHTIAIIAILSGIIGLVLGITYHEDVMNYYDGVFYKDKS